MQTVGSTDMANRAQALSAKVNKEDGVQRAVETISKFMASASI